MWCKIVAPCFARPTRAARDKRVDRNPRAVKAPADDGPRAFMPQDQRGGAAVVVTEIGMHVRATNADAVDADQVMCVIGCWSGSIAVNQLFRASIDKRLHFAVKPPSTIRTWPVT